MRKLSKINETLWGDMMDRSSGIVTRKEDDVNLLDGEHMAEYIKDHYNVQDTFYRVAYTNDMLHIPLIKQKRISISSSYQLFYDYRFNTIGMERYIPDKIMDIIKSNPEFELEYGNHSFFISPKNGEVNNKFLIDFIDFIIDNVNKKSRVIDKKIYETL